MDENKEQPKPKCKYISPSGKKCGAFAALNPEYQGYCAGHAFKNGVVTRRTRESLSLKIKEGQIKKFGPMHNKKQELTQGDINKSRQLYHDIIGDKYIDISVLVKEIGQNINIESYKQNLLVMWFNSDPETRYPKTLSELAKILDTTNMKLIEWTKTN